MRCHSCNAFTCARGMMQSLTVEMYALQTFGCTCLCKWFLVGVYVHTSVAGSHECSIPIDLTKYDHNNVVSTGAICKGHTIISQGKRSNKATIALTKNYRIQKEVIAAGWLQNIPLKYVNQQVQARIQQRQ